MSFICHRLKKLLTQPSSINWECEDSHHIIVVFNFILQSLASSQPCLLQLIVLIKQHQLCEGHEFFYELC